MLLPNGIWVLLTQVWQNIWFVHLFLMAMLGFEEKHKWIDSHINMKLYLWMLLLLLGAALNDGQWHSVELSSRQGRLSVVVDREEGGSTQTISSFPLVVERSIFFGGRMCTSQLFMHVLRMQTVSFHPYRNSRHRVEFSTFSSVCDRYKKKDTICFHW